MSVRRQGGFLLALMLGISSGGAMGQDSDAVAPHVDTPSSAAAAVPESPKDDDKAQDKDKSKESIKLDGRLDVGFKIKGTENGSSEVEAKLKLKTKRRKGTRAVMRLEASYEEREAYIQEGFIDHKFKNGNRLEFGLNRKRFGLEYEFSSDEHPLFKESILYRKLEDFGFVGRELLIRLIGAANEEGDDAPFAVSAGYSESLDTHVNGHYQWNLSDTGTKLGTWLLVQNDRIDSATQVSWVHGWALWQRNSARHWEVELMGGMDPFETEFEKTFGDGSKVYFYGFKGMWSYRIGDGDLQEETWEPIFLLSHVVHDSREPDYNSLQVGLGMNYHFHKDFLVGLQLDGVGTNSRLDKDKRTYDDSRSMFLARLFF